MTNNKKDQQHDAIPLAAPVVTAEAESDADAIKTMKLYTHMDRIHRELEEAGLWSEDASTPLDPEALSAFDSLHYLGNEAIRNAMQAIRMADQETDNDASSVTTVLDIGSGLGGPARMLAHWTDYNVHALELQADLHTMACSLTERCRLSDRVQHVCRDILNCTLNCQYQAIVSWLVFLHIKERSRLFARCADCLVDNGVMYVEDFCKIGETDFSSHEKELLAREIYVTHQLPTWKQLEQELQDAGFEVISMRDMSTQWCNYVCERRDLYASQLDRHIRVHGESGAKSLKVFYDAVQDLFQGGRLGGVAYVVRKKA